MNQNQKYDSVYPRAKRCWWRVAEHLLACKWRGYEGGRDACVACQEWAKDACGDGPGFCLAVCQCCGYRSQAYLRSEGRGRSWSVHLVCCVQGVWSLACDPGALLWGSPAMVALESTQASQIDIWMWVKIKPLGDRRF